MKTLVFSALMLLPVTALAQTRLCNDEVIVKLIKPMVTSEIIKSKDDVLKIKDGNKVHSFDIRIMVVKDDQNVFRIGTWLTSVENEKLEKPILYSIMVPHEKAVYVRDLEVVSGICFEKFPMGKD